MRALFALATAPLWLPAIFAIGAASLSIGIVVTVMSHALKDKPTRDNWRLD